jgi:hypothetical protein
MQPSLVLVKDVVNCIVKHVLPRKKSRRIKMASALSAMSKIQSRKLLLDSSRTLKVTRGLSAKVVGIGFRDI